MDEVQTFSYYFLFKYWFILIMEHTLFKHFHMYFFNNKYNIYLLLYMYYFICSLKKNYQLMTVRLKR